MTNTLTLVLSLTDPVILLNIILLYPVRVTVSFSCVYFLAFRKAGIVHSLRVSLP